MERSASSRQPTWPRVAGGAVALSALYALGASLPFLYMNVPAASGAFFPAAGLTVATLILTPRRLWPIWLGTVALTELAVDLGHGLPLPLALGFALANTMEPLVGATILRRIVDRPTTAHRALYSYLGAAVVTGPLVGAMIAASAAVALERETGWLYFASTWVLGDGLGVLIVATPILAWCRPAPFERRASPPELAAIVVLATGLVLVPAMLWRHPALYAVTIVTVVAAIRGGSRAVTAAGAGMAFAANWAVTTGRAADVVAGTEGHQLVLVQAYLAVTLLAGLILAVEIADHRRTGVAERRAQAERVALEHRVYEIATSERRRLAHETHDVVGHGLSVMVLQAGAVRRVLHRDPALAESLLESMERVGRRACTELDVALGPPNADGSPTVSLGLGDVPELVDEMRQAGLHVSLDVTGERVETSTLVDTSGYRVVQEALTNIARHARRATSKVTISYEPDAVTVAVLDDGDRSLAAPLTGRRGLVAMRERVTALGGDLDAGPEPPHGFVVRARFPLRRGAR